MPVARKVWQQVSAGNPTFRARRLIIPHPRAGKPKIDVTAPLPAHMLVSWEMLGLNPNQFEVE